MVSDAVRSKAERLLSKGRVHPRPNGEEFDVVGDHGTYSVYLPSRRLDLRGACTCEGSKYAVACSHIEAAKLMVAAETGGEV